MATAINYTIVDEKNIDVFYSGRFDINQFYFYSFKDNAIVDIPFQFDLDTIQKKYQFEVQDASYTREGYPLVLDFGVQKDTVILKEIGFNSCTGPINKIEVSSGISKVENNKIVLK